MLRMKAPALLLGVLALVLLVGGRSRAVLAAPPGPLPRPKTAPHAPARFSAAAVPVKRGATAAAFGPPTSYPVGNRPGSVTVADLNGDGFPDLIVTNAGNPGGGDNGSVSVLLGNQQGTFTQTANFGAGITPAAVAVGDFNGDSRLDLAVAVFNSCGGSLTSGCLLVFNGNGNGTFSPTPTILAAGHNPDGVVVADFNGDGRPDIAVANYGTNSVSVLINNGNGFNTAVTYAVGAAPTAIVAAPLTGSGHIDLAVTNASDGTVSVLPGHGDGTFGTAATYPVGQLPQDLVAADLNGDGRPDLVVANAGDNTVSVLLNNAAGGFQAAQTYAVGTQPYAVAVNQFTPNAPLSIAVANNGSCSATLPTGCVSMLLNAGGGVFQVQQTAFGAGTSPSFLASGDFNHDGKPDLAVTDTGGNSVSILLNTTGVATHFAVGAPATIASGATFSPAVTALDSAGNIATNYRGTIRFTSSDSEAVLPGNYTFSVLDNGTHTFNNAASLSTPGNQSLTVTDTGQSSLSGSTTIAVSMAACTGATLTATPATTQTVGQSVTLNASASGCPAPQFRYWMLPPGGSWVMLQDYTANASYVWNTPNLAAGNYTLAIWARNLNSTAPYEAYSVISYSLVNTPCASASLSASPVGSQVVGQAVQLAATASGCSFPQYEFWVLQDGHQWVVGQPYSAVSNLTWQTVGDLPAAYELAVWVREAGSPAVYDAWALIGYTLTASTASACASATLTASPAGSQVVGSPVTLNASSTGCASPLYEYWVLPPGGNWTVVQSYTASSPFIWQTAGAAAGSYDLAIWAVNNGDGVPYEAYDVIGYTLTSPSGGTQCTSVTITANPPGSQTAGQPVQITASGTGCNTPEYDIWVTGTTIQATLLQSYSTNATVTWNTSGVGPGSFTFTVYVKDASSPASYDAVNTISYTLH